MSAIIIDYRDRRPIYEQLISNIRNMVLKEIIGAGEFLPSVRSLAVELGINPNTIQKAYAELERQGVIISVSGKGSMITDNLNTLIEGEKSSILRIIEQYSHRALELGIETDTVITTVRKVMEGDMSE